MNENATAATEPIRGGLRIGIALPQPGDGVREPLSKIRSFSRAAERLGFDSLWTVSPFEVSTAGVDPFVALTAAASYTTRIRLGIAVLALPLRAPVEVARTAAALDLLSGGRLELGLGLGDSAPGVMSSVGLTPPDRVPRFVDGLTVLRALWKGERVTAHGRTLLLEDWLGHPMPVQRPGPPIWMGGHHQNALRRAAEFADGWIGAGGRGVREYALDISMLREELARAEIDLEGFGLGKRVYVMVADDPRACRPFVRRWSQAQYGDVERGSSVCVSGTPGTIAEFVDDLVQMGTSLIILNPIVPSLRQMYRLADEVVPHVLSTAEDRGAGYHAL